MKRTYFVTGGAGFIGSNYIHYMFEKYGDSIQIINADKLTYAGRLENLAEVEDHVKAIDLVQEQGRLFETYNIGGYNEKTNLEIVNTILEVLREALEENAPRKRFINDSLIQYVEDRKGHDRRYAINADKIRRETGWMPETSFEEGIRKTVRWYLENEKCVKY